MATQKRKTAYPEASTVIAIAGEIAVSLNDIRESSAVFFSKEPREVLSQKIDRVADAAKLLRLRSLAKLLGYSSELIKRVESNDIELLGGEEVVFLEAIETAGQYVASVLQGKICSGRQLVRPCRSIMKILGHDSANIDGEMFLPVFPISGVALNAVARKKYVLEIARFYPEFSTAREKFVELGGVDAVHAMRTSLVSIESKNPLADFGLFISMAIAYFDVALRESSVEDVIDASILQSIDTSILDATNGSFGVNDDLCSTLLARVAKSPGITARVRIVDEVYDLQRITEDDITTGINEAFLDRMRGGLIPAQKSWEAAFNGAPAFESLKTSIAALNDDVKSVGDYSLQTLFASLGTFIAALHAGHLEPSNEIAIFGATVFLAIGDRLDSIVSDPRGGRAIADYHRDRINAVVSGVDIASVAIEKPVKSGHVEGIIEEVKNDLKSVELIIDQCLRDGPKQSKIDEAAKIFTSVRSAYSFVNLANAAEVADLVGAYVLGVLGKALGGDEVTIKDRSTLADSLMMSQKYVDLIFVDVAQANAALDAAKALFASDSRISEALYDELPTTFDRCTDLELGPIFFEEAQDVIRNTILPGIEALRSNPSDESVFLDVRRGFHTLKGSARMVDLSNLGMIGQHIEYLLNHIRDNQKLSVTPPILDWLKCGAQFFSDAISALETGVPVEADPAEFEITSTQYIETNIFSAKSVDVADDAFKVDPSGSISPENAVDEIREVVQIEEASGQVLEVVSESLSEAASEPVPESVSETASGAVLVIGEKVVASSLYETFIVESRAFFDVLREKVLSVVSGEVNRVDYETLRMAHSIAGMGATIGMPAIVSLAEALELWATGILEKEIRLDKREGEILRNALESLDAMILGIAERIEPLPDDALVSRLRAIVLTHESSHSGDEKVLESDSAENPVESAVEISAVRAESSGAQAPSGQIVDLELMPIDQGDEFDCVNSDLAEPAPTMDLAENSRGDLSSELQLVDIDSVWRSSDVDSDQEGEVDSVSDEGMKLALVDDSDLIFNTPSKGESRVDAVEAIEKIVAASEDPADEICSDVEYGSGASIVEGQDEIPYVGVFDAQIAATPPIAESEVGSAPPYGDETRSDAEGSNHSEVLPGVVEGSFDEHPVDDVVVDMVVEGNQGCTDEALSIELSANEVVAQPEPADSVIAPCDVVSDSTNGFEPEAPVCASNDSADVSPVGEASPDLVPGAGAVAAAQSGSVREIDTVDICNEDGAPNDEFCVDCKEDLEEDFERDISKQLVVDESACVDEALDAADQTIGPVETTISGEPDTISVEVVIPEVDVIEVPESVEIFDSEANASDNDWLALVDAKADDIDVEMFEIFYDEAEGRFEEIDSSLSGLRQNIGDRRLADTLKRAIHTLKGSANTAGARKVGALFHHLEDLMDNSVHLSTDQVEVIQIGVDAAFAAITAVKEGRSVSRSVARTVAKADAGVDFAEIPESISISEFSTEKIISSSMSSLIDDSQEISESGSIMPSSHNVGLEGDSQTTALAESRRSSKKRAKDSDSGDLRVSSGILDDMVKSVGEINISRNRVGLNIRQCKSSLGGLSRSVNLMAALIREIELEGEKQMFTGSDIKASDKQFDALQMDRFTRLQELTRRVAEAQNDIVIQQSEALSSVRDMEDAVAAQHVLINGLSSNLDQIRQVRVSSAVPALKRVVRQAARDTGKNAEIFFDADVEIDRGILSRVTSSLEHILRNAIAHGIESEAGRISASKSAVGTIEFSAFHDGGEVVIEVRDDGAGIDPKKILKKAREKGVVAADEQLSDEKAMDLLFEPGFSTADAVTDIAGRGVGLDVVRSEIASMGGRIELTSALGSGTKFTLRVPATLTVLAGAAVSANSHVYVVPVAFIDKLIRVSQSDVESAYASRKIAVHEPGGEVLDYEFWGMWEIAGCASNELRLSNRNSVLLMRDEKIAVHVEDVRPAAEFVFRAMGPQISSSSGLIGSTISANGNASLVVDPVRIAKILRGGRSGSDPESRSSAALEKLVLIVDDSLTVRSATARLLKKNGFRYMMAENGMQALERIREESPDVILMDIEMPVMNGFEATQAIRAIPEFISVPIVMITSRSGDAHREKAFGIGVNEYLGKPYNDSALIEIIRRYVCGNVQK